MKFLALYIAALAVFPISLLLRSHRGFREIFWTIFGTLPFLAATLPMFATGVVTFEGWIGFVYSLEITLLDILAIAGLMSLGARSVSIPFRYTLPVMFFVFTAILSIFQADEPLAAMFGAWQFARMGLIMIVVAKLCYEPTLALSLLRGMAIGMSMHLVTVIYQRFGLHLTQTPGLFVHQNTLGMTAHLVLFPCLALLLYGYPGLRSQLATAMATMVVVVFTASRAAVGFSAFGIGLIYVLSALAGLTSRKILFAALGVLGLALVGPMVISSFEQRFEAAPLTEDQYDERAAFNRAATYILQEHPFGVGSNHYVHVAKNGGYSERAGVAPSEVNRNNIVHNAYLLAGAETGYLGLLSFIVVLLVPLAVALSEGWRHRQSAEGHLLLGFGVAMAVVYVHSFFEWVTFSREVQYLLFMAMGMTYGIVLRLRARVPVRRNSGARLASRCVMVGSAETPQSG